jgi:hypothetical protein
VCGALDGQPEVSIVVVRSYTFMICECVIYVIFSVYIEFFLMLEKVCSECVSNIKYDYQRQIKFVSLRYLHTQWLDHLVRFFVLYGYIFTLLCLTVVSCTLRTGLALTCADSGCPRLDLLGPPGLKDFWTSTASFTHRKQHVVQAVEVNSVVELDTGEVRLEAVPLIKHEKQSINPTIDESFNPHVIVSPTHICYVCQTKSLPGRFDIQKARSLGVPVGPMCATLKSGQDVTLEDGTVVRSVDVIGASEPARFVAIICNISSPSEAASCSSSCNDSLLQMLVSDPYWTRYVY